MIYNRPPQGISNSGTRREGGNSFVYNIRKEIIHDINIIPIQLQFVSFLLKFNFDFLPQINNLQHKPLSINNNYILVVTITVLLLYLQTSGRFLYLALQIFSLIKFLEIMFPTDKVFLYVTMPPALAK